jgi:hypothetical protein
MTARHKMFGKSVLKTFAQNHISPGMSEESYDLNIVLYFQNAVLNSHFREKENMTHLKN